MDSAEVAIRVTPQCGWSEKNRSERRWTSCHRAPAWSRAQRESFARGGGDEITPALRRPGDDLGPVPPLTAPLL